MSFSRPEFVLICFHNLAPRHIKLGLPRFDYCISHGTNSSALDRRVGAFEEMARWSAEARTITTLGDAEDRKVRRVKPLCLTAFRKALRERTYNKVTETRGRKRNLGPRAVAVVNANRRL